VRATRFRKISVPSHLCPVSHSEVKITRPVIHIQQCTRPSACTVGMAARLLVWWWNWETECGWARRQKRLTRTSAFSEAGRMIEWAYYYMCEVSQWACWQCIVDQSCSSADARVRNYYRKLNIILSLAQPLVASTSNACHHCVCSSK
jgi:hypothetical protein